LHIAKLFVEIFAACQFRMCSFIAFYKNSFQVGEMINKTALCVL